MDVKTRCALAILQLLSQMALRMAVGPIEQLDIHRLGKEHSEFVMIDPTDLALHAAIALLYDADQRERLQTALRFRPHSMGRQVGHNGRATAAILKFDLDIGPPVNAFLPLARGRRLRSNIKVKAFHFSNDGRIDGGLTHWGRKRSLCLVNVRFRDMADIRT